AERVKDQAMALGLMCYPSQGCADGRHGDHVLLAPPYAITREQLAEITELLGRAVDNAIAAATI
ncbi:MAG: aspartate aminotransferase family protein, partial [Pseudomonadota bacterium]